MHELSILKHSKATSDPLAWLLLSKAPGLGPIRTRQLLDRFGSPENIINAPIRSLVQAKCPISARRWLQQACQKEVQHELHWLSQENNHLISVQDNHYPQQLRSLHDAPTVLFVKGLVDVLNLPQIAMVGSRHPTQDGKHTAIQFAQHLAAGGLVITSGLALGLCNRA